MTTIDLDTLTLTSGSHDTRDQGVCFMEAVAWWAGQDHTDHPPCVSPILAAFGIRLNDYWNDADRQQLRPFIPRLPGTAGDGQDQTRGYLALDWFIRTYTVAWLDLAGLADEATSLRELDPITDMDTADAAGPVVRRARDKAAAAWAAAGAAAGAAARAAARDVALAAARATARDAAGAAARAAAWAAARDAALAEARDAARDAALAAAGAAARAKLASTVAILQVSMLDLFNRMIDARQETS